MTDNNKKRSTARSEGALNQIRDFIRRSSLSSGEASKAMGYSDHSIGYWEKEGKAPVVAGLAAECLIRRMGQGTNYTPPDKERVFIFKAPSRDVDLLLATLKKFGVNVKEI